MVFASVSIVGNRIGLGDTRPMEYAFGIIHYPVECMDDIWLSRPRHWPGRTPVRGSCHAWGAVKPMDEASLKAESQQEP